MIEVPHILASELDAVAAFLPTQCVVDDPVAIASSAVRTGSQSVITGYAHGWKLRQRHTGQPERRYVGYRRRGEVTLLHEAEPEFAGECRREDVAPGGGAVIIGPSIERGGIGGVVAFD